MKKIAYYIIISFYCISILFSQNQINTIDFNKYIKSIKKFFSEKEKNIPVIPTGRPIVVKLNTSPNRLDDREWIPYIDGNEIPLSAFWKIIGNIQNEAYWVHQEEILKGLKERRFNYKRVLAGSAIFMLGGIIGKKNVEIIPLYDGNYFERTTYNIQNLENYILIFGGIGIIVNEIIISPVRGVIIRFNEDFPLKNIVSYYEIKKIVDTHNQDL